MALLHPNGETFDNSMGLRGLFDALTKIATQPEKDFGELVRQCRRMRRLPVAPVGKVLSFLPVQRDDHPAKRAALDGAAERILQETIQGNKLHAAQVRLAEKRLLEAFNALEQAEWRNDTPRRLAQLMTSYQQALAAYEALSRQPSAEE
jgi:hypothetical protein